METVVLKGSDFTRVHNTLCELRSVEQELTGIIGERILERLHRTIKGFEAGLADAYEQDNRAFTRKNDLYDEIRTAEKFQSIWSIYEVDDLDALHPFGDVAQVGYTEHWGKPTFSEIKGPTWRDLWRAADHCIRNSGDDHHIFIERFRHNELEPAQLLLQTGS
jgi:hypothetical protein